MAEPLVAQYGAHIPRRIARDVARVHPAFPAKAFVRDCLAGYEALALMARGTRIADALRSHLPGGFGDALAILMRSVDEGDGPPAEGSLASFFYLPHTLFVGRHGLDDFEASMAAQRELTRRFTAEFSIRPFLERHPARTLERLAEWCSDPDRHVRRLVSEGTRPRLPWAPRLRAFQRDPSPVLALLERLRDDPEPYVRRSVANNLNDIGKDHPEVLLEVCARWLVGAGEGRRWIVGHALRSRLKAGDPRALAAMGQGEARGLRVVAGTVSPARARRGTAVVVAFEVRNAAKEPRAVRADFRIHYVKANGGTSPKTFRLGQAQLGPGEWAAFSRRVSLAPMTTRRHYPGVHRVEAVVNGAVTSIGAFRLS